MSIPDFQTLMLPVLRVAAEGEMRISDVVERLAAELGLTAEERSHLLPSGRQTTFANRVHWAKSYLGKAGLVELTKRAHFRATEKGHEVLAAPPERIDIKYLNRFPGFQQFREGEDEKEDGETGSALLPITDKAQALTPDEVMRTAHRHVRGRSTNLKVNYRTSHQIREHADRLLDREVSDSDGNVEDRRGTVSVFNGPLPEVHSAAKEASEQRFVASWLRARCDEGYRTEDMVLFVRSMAQLDRAEAAAKDAGLPCKRLEKRMEVSTGVLPISTMRLAKGLEFRAVVVMACDESVLPDAERIEGASDTLELEEIYNSERQLLYVACTRARDRLLITSSGEASEFLRDFGGNG